MDLSLKLINYMPSVGDACLADCATTHTILRDKKYFSNFTLAQSNVHTISGPVDLIKGSGRGTIILPKGTKFQIEDALYLNKSSRNLLSFKDIHRNGYHIEIMKHDENEYLLITSIISGQKCILATIRSIESYAIMNQKFHNTNAFLLWYYVGFQSASIINYIEPLTGEVFTARFADCHFDENFFPPLGGDKPIPEEWREISWN